MASNVALMGVAGLDCYTAAKGGIAAIARSMAVEFAPQKVRVNAIAPAARMSDRVRSRFEAGQSKSDENRGGASDRSNRTGGYRQYGGVPGIRRITDGNRPCVSGGQRENHFLMGRYKFRSIAPPNVISC
jgi:NAD(P)-dependent dehydrogenase (short-subunit alcohol dehydrogenase family)